MTREPETLTPPWAYYRRTGLSEMRPYVRRESLVGISVSDPDRRLIAFALDNGLDPGGYIARNPENHADQWYVAQAYFDENLEPVGVPVVARDEAAEGRADGQYPEHDKLAEIKDQSQVVGEFLDWLGSEKGIWLAKADGYGFSPARESWDALLAEFFGIDREKLEVEKREMLASMRHRAGTDGAE